MKPFINRDLVLERMVSLRLPEVEGLAGGRDLRGKIENPLIFQLPGAAAANLR